jgi:flagellar biosynthesis/type III secretory pathway protein FliH
VLSPDELRAVQDAGTLAAQCEQRCRALLAQAQRQAQAQFDAGLRRGLQEGAARCAAQLLAYEASQQAQWQRQEQDVLAIAMLVLERVAPTLGQGELVRALVRQAVAEARQARRLLIKVHPDAVAGVQAELGRLQQSCAWLESLDVIGVPEFDADHCVLESPHGYVNAGWPTQLAAIRQTLEGTAAASALPP